MTTPSAPSIPATNAPSTPRIGSNIRIGPAPGRRWHDLAGVLLHEPRTVIVTSHVFRAVDRGDVQWLDAAVDTAGQSDGDAEPQGEADSAS